MSGRALRRTGPAHSRYPRAAAGARCSRGPESASTGPVMRFRRLQRMLPDAPFPRRVGRQMRRAQPDLQRAPGHRMVIDRLVIGRDHHRIDLGACANSWSSDQSISGLPQIGRKFLPRNALRSLARADMPDDHAKSPVMRPVNARVAPGAGDPRRSCARSRSSRGRCSTSETGRPATRCRKSRHRGKEHLVALERQVQDARCPAPSSSTIAPRDQVEIRDDPGPAQHDPPEADRRQVIHRHAADHAPARSAPPGSRNPRPESRHAPGRHLRHRQAAGNSVCAMSSSWQRSSSTPPPSGRAA